MKRVVLMLICLFLAAGSAAAQEGENTVLVYGVPPEGEAVLDLSGLWRVETVTRLDEDLYAVGYDDAAWREVIAPARWAE